MIDQVLKCSAVVLVDIVFEASLKTSSLVRENILKIETFIQGVQKTLERFELNFKSLEYFLDTLYYCHLDCLLDQQPLLRSQRS